MFEEVRRNY